MHGYEAITAGCWVFDYSLELDDIGVVAYSIEDFDLSLHFTFLDWLQHLDDNILIGGGVDASVHFRVLALAYFGYYLIFIDVTAGIGCMVTRTRSSSPSSCSRTDPFACSRPRTVLASLGFASTPTYAGVYFCILFLWFWQIEGLS